MQKSIEQIRFEHDAALSALQKSAAMLRGVSAAASDKLSAVKAEIEQEIERAAINTLLVALLLLAGGFFE